MSKQRIGLFTPKASFSKKKDAATTTTTYVEVATVVELGEALNKLGAKRVGLLKKDRLGATSLEGKMFEVASLKAEHLTWVTEKAPSFETRGLFYEAV